jgi:hypothetical protein
MRAVLWRAGELYRCLNSRCECEIIIAQLPRTGRTLESLPTCCSCGTPMQRVSELQESRS